MSDIRDLIAQFDAVLTTLRRDAQRLATCLDEGSQINLARAHLLRAEINRTMLGLNQLLVRASALPESDDLRAKIELREKLASVPQLISAWHGCDRLLRDQIPPRQRPLFSWSHEDHSPEEAPLIAADMLFRQMHQVLSAEPQSDMAREHGCYADIPMIFSVFFRNALAARRVLMVQKPKKPTRFLDVGCGVGMKVLAASQYFSGCFGLEFDPAYARQAQALFDRAHARDCTVIEGDALTYEGYGDFDVIYFYRPMRDPKTLATLEDHIIAQSPPGTLIIAPYLFFAGRHQDMGCVHLGGHLYATGMSRDAAKALVQEAEFTGLDLASSNPPPETILSPILHASSARGFEITSALPDVAVKSTTF